MSSAVVQSMPKKIQGNNVKLSVKPQSTLKSGATMRSKTIQNMPIAKIDLNDRKAKVPGKEKKRDRNAESGIVNSAAFRKSNQQSNKMLRDQQEGYARAKAQQEEQAELINMPPLAVN